jgi:dihydrofolate synthase/folylpolyglutamate synthase
MNETMTYHEAVYYVEHASKRKLLSPIYLRLERLKLLFAKLDIDLNSPSIHIAGTSGKGSTSTLCASVLQAAGYTVGLHTTPHLQTPRERMQVNNQLPTEAEFTQLVTEVKTAIEYVEAHHSYGAFNTQEVIFALTALYFKQQKVDIAVIETFMGGQYDPTNIIKPLVSVITNVDLDHTRLLGKTIESIATVKAGVIKNGVPFITGATQPSVLDIFHRRCADLNTSCLIVGKEDYKQSRMMGRKGSLLSVQVLNQLFAKLHISLLGKHQINNALMVLYILQVIRNLGWLVPDEAIRQGFTESFIPGRLEIIQENPTVILDGAHNPAKTKALAASLRRIFPKQKIIFVFAMKKGKDLEESIKPLLPLAKKFIVTRFSEKKSRSTAYINKHLRVKSAVTTTRLDPVTALNLAKKQAKTGDVICVTGSLYLVGRLRNQWYPQGNEAATITIDDTPWGSIVGEPTQQSEIVRS